MNYIEHIILKHKELACIKTPLFNAYDQIVRCYRGKGKLIICGNGGSASDSEHIVGELMKSFLLPRRIDDEHFRLIENRFPDDSEYFYKTLQKGLPAISLVSQSSLITAIANDIGADMIFAQQVYAYGNAGDILFALSTSGNSKNVVNAVKIALCKGVTTIGMTGQTPSELSRLCDIVIDVPATGAYYVQQYHTVIFHALCAAVEHEFFNIERESHSFLDI